MRLDLSREEKFENRHNGFTEKDISNVLDTVGVSDIDHLIDETIPGKIRLEKPLGLPKAKSEHVFLREFKSIAQKNKVLSSFIGMGYYGTITPAVIQRNILENPGWYTAYTPYQAEIAQGRLEALANFQTMVMDLTGMEIANASLLDEGTAAAEAMILLSAARKGIKKKANKFFVDRKIFPQTIDILRARAIPQGIEIEEGNFKDLDLNDEDLFGVIVQYPNGDGAIEDYEPFIRKGAEKEVQVTVIADLLSLTIYKSPGAMGADVVVGTTQRFGVPLGFGGPHAAYFATKDKHKRQVPGRMIGLSVDRSQKPAYRMALQTREQHIRREKATSNICTAQVLLAVMAGMYGVYHGPEGLRDIALKIHGLASWLDSELKKMGYVQLNELYFDTLQIRIDDPAVAKKIRSLTVADSINLRYFSDHSIGISFDETHDIDITRKLAAIFAEAIGKEPLVSDNNAVDLSIPENLKRKHRFLEHPVFHQFHTEHEMLRYLKRLENKDLSLTHSMISLGSCTMKLNATAEMIPISWSEMANIHPFSPEDQVKGYHHIFNELSQWLSEITGFSATTLQPNSGAQGEFTGLMIIKAYHEHNGEAHRNVALIPSSAHGTNPASAVMAGMQVVIVQCDQSGNIDITDLKEKAEQHKEHLAALIVTYPSTHGVFEEEIIEICNIVHESGGQIYMDGANMNAQVGLTSPARIGADVCHLNLHKTFSIPHGGGGPGMGPVCVAAHLEKFLPGHTVVKTGGQHAIGAVSAAPWGSASILSISYAYIAMMGGEGLTKASKLAILNANYIKERLSEYFDILYTNKNGRNAHELIVDCRAFKTHGIEVEDIAKRLMDYGFHAPTVSFPVAGTLMIEPTESESLSEIDCFCSAMIQIRAEIKEVEDGSEDRDINVLKNAPHTMALISSDQWELPYSREKAAFPLPYLRDHKFWPAVSRIDNAYGDRNLVCTCMPIEDYIEEESGSI